MKWHKKPAQQPTTATVLNTATVNTNDTRNIDIATAMSSPVKSMPDTSLFTYSHEEVYTLLEEAKLDGWQEGYEEGSRKLMQSYREGYEA